jgi:phage shock protein PspC (stress-responsive transcriptional regulator)
MTEASTPPPNAPGGPTPAPPSLGDELRALRRSRSDRVIAGVLGGLGRRLGIDPLVLRIVTVVLAIFGGIGVLLYAAAWLLIPAEDDEASVAEQALGRAGTGSPRTATAALALGLALVVLVSVGGIFGGPRGGGILLVLAVVGLVVLLRRGDNPPSRDPGTIDEPDHPGTGYSGFTDYPGYPGYPGHSGSAAAVTAPLDDAARTDVAPTDRADAGAAGAATDQPAAPTGAAVDQPAATTGAAPDQQAATVPPAPEGTTRWWKEGPDWEIDQRTWSADDSAWDPYAEPESVPPVTPRHPRSALGPITVSAAAVAVGVLAVNDAVWATVPPATYVATALGIVGLGLLVGSWWGRSRGLIVLGIALVIGLVPAVAVDRFEFEAGDVSIRPTSVDAIPTDTQSHGIGDVRYDLSALDFTEADSVTLHIEQDVGQLTVVVPPGVDVVVDAHNNVGEISTFGNRAGGLGQERRITDDGADGRGGGELTLDLELGIGEIEVRREGP